MSSWKKVLVHQGVVPDDLAASGTNGQVLAVNGAGALAWADDSDYTDTEAIAAINGETSLDIDITGNAATVTNGVYTTGDQNIGGNKTFNDNVTVSGTLRVTGSSTSVDTTHLKVQDQVLEINYDAATSAYATTDSAIILGHANHANGAKIINHAGTGLRFTSLKDTDVIGGGTYVDGGTTTAGSYISVHAKNMVSSAKVSGTFANFANSAGPPSPTVGDLYYDSSDDELKIYI